MREAAVYDRIKETGKVKSILPCPHLMLCIAVQECYFLAVSCEIADSFLPEFSKSDRHHGYPSILRAAHGR